MLARVLDGHRHIPATDNFLASASLVCKSIAQGLFSSNAHKQQAAESVPLETVLVDEPEALTVPGIEYRAAKAGDIDRRIAAILAYFKHDQAVTTLLQATLAGLKPKEMVKTAFAGDNKTYDAARKRFTRAIPYLKQEALNHE